MKSALSKIFSVKILVGCLFLVMAAALFFSLFEIVPQTKRTRASSLAQENYYLALDRWLQAEGHPLRILEYADVKTLKAGRAAEKTVLIYSSSFDWKNAEELAAYIDGGGKAVIFIDDMGSDNLSSLLSHFDIEYRIFNSFNNNDDAEADDAVDKDKSPKLPVLDDDVYFKKTGGAFKTGGNNWYLSGSRENIHLVSLEYGKGRLLVTGIPNFMQWGNLRHIGSANDLYAQQVELNRYYAWQLSGALDGEKNGILIIRNKLSSRYKIHDGLLPSFWELFWQNRQSIALALSLFFVLLAGFWMTFPAFGKWKKERILPGKSVKERFLTEGRFFKKYRCLGLYLEPIATQLRTHYHQYGIMTDEEIIDHLVKNHNIDEPDARSLFQKRGDVKIEDILRCRRLGERVLISQKTRSYL